MGLSAFWAQLTGPKVKEIGDKSETDPQSKSQAPPKRNRPWLKKINTRHEPTQPDASVLAAEKKNRRRSRTLTSLKNNKSESDLALKKRKSWFMSKPAEGDNSELPAVPTLPAFRPSSSPAHGPFNDNESVRPGTAVTTDESVSIAWSKPTSPVTSQFREPRRDRRLSGASSALRHRRSVSQRNATAPVPASPSKAKSKRRQSWFAPGSVPQQEAPPTPTIMISPSAPGQLVDPQSGVLPPNPNASKRKSLGRALFIHKSKSATDLSDSTKRWSWMDAGDGQSEGEAMSVVPSVPALESDRGEKSPSSSPDTSASRGPSSPLFQQHTERFPSFHHDAQPSASVSPNSFITTREGKSLADDCPVQESFPRSSDSIRQPRPLSLPPAPAPVAARSAQPTPRLIIPPTRARGVARDTDTPTPRTVSGASLTSNRAVRMTMIEDADRGTFGLSEEQQLEWEKLKTLMGSPKHQVMPMQMKALGPGEGQGMGTKVDSVVVGQDDNRF